MPAAAGGGRLNHFAAHPGEHVVNPGIITTLLPHAGQRKAHEFRLALLAGLAVLFILYAAGFVASALVAAALLVPVLYLIYLYEAQVYRDEPATVLGYTIGAGLLLGAVVTIATNFVVGTRSAVTASDFANDIDVGRLLLVAVLIPIIHEALKPLPVLLLRRQLPPWETADGFVFGVAAGLGFALVQSLINLSPAIAALGPRTEPANWIYPLLSVAVLSPVLQGSATGAVVMGLWRLGRSRLARNVVAPIAAALIAHVAFSLGTELLGGLGVGLPVVLAWQGLIVGGLLVYVRLLLHQALIEEASNMGLVETTCPNCQARSHAAGFCPECGKALALRAGPSRPDLTPAGVPR